MVSVFTSGYVNTETILHFFNIWTGDKDVNMKATYAVMNTTWAVVFKSDCQ